MRPSVRPYLILREFDDCRLIFGSGNGAKELELTAPIRRLVEMCDGSNTLEEIGDELSDAYGVSRQDVAAAVAEMVKAGLLEDSHQTKVHSLSDAEVERYDRQILFQSTFDTDGSGGLKFQERLKKSSILIIGCGGVGSHTFMHLMCMGVGKVRVVDFDTVETSNLNRSFVFRDKDVSRLKIDVLREQAKEINPYVECDFITQRISSSDDIRPLLTGVDFAVLCADTPRAKINKWFNSECVRAGIPYSLAGSADQHGSIGPITVPGETSCFECQEYDQTSLEEGPEYVRRVNAARRASSFVSIISTVASINSSEIAKYLTGVAASPLLGKQLQIDFGSLAFNYVDMPRNPGCAICG
jgi:molybdopterin/thiamine biosynthesis adenylyltransferase